VQEVWDLILYNFVGILVVFARVTGIFIFNPILSRGTVPVQVRIAMSVVLTFVMVGSIGDVIGFIPMSIPHFVGVLILEAALGFVFGFIVNMVLSVIILGGKLMDNQMMLALAEMFDPTTGITMPIMASLYHYIFVLYFFIAGGHLSYIRLFHLSYEIIPIGFELSDNWLYFSYNISNFFAQILILAVTMAMPLIVAQLILQICVGVIMKAVPQIQIFIVNIQMRVMMGLFMVVTITPAMADFLRNIMDIMFENLFETMHMLGG